MNDDIKLFVDFPGTPDGDDAQAFAWLEGADALVMDPCRCAPGRFESMPVEMAVLLNGDPVRDAPWCDAAALWVSDRGLEDTARLRDLHPALQWIPRLSLTRAEMSYRFSGPAIGEGFSFYMPDTGAIHGWRLNGGDQGLPALLSQAAALGFSALWLDSPQAATLGRGLELDLLERSHGSSLEIWLSGGASETRHLRNLSRLGGAAAVVVDEALVRQCSLPALREALTPEPVRPAAVPVDFKPAASRSEQA